MATTLRIGAGAGFAGDRIGPALDLAQRAELDFLVFECLAERTIALAHLRRQSGIDAGFDPLLEERLGAVLPVCLRNGTRIVSNMGAANPRAAARATVRLAGKLGLHGLRVAFVEGDDVLHAVDHLLPFEKEQLPSEAPISANAYLGAEAIADALREGADVVLTGRTSTLR